MAIWKTVEHFITNLRKKNYGDKHEVERRFVFRKYKDFIHTSIPEIHREILIMSNSIATLTARVDACKEAISILTMKEKLKLSPEQMASLFETTATKDDENRTVRMH